MFAIHQRMEIERVGAVRHERLFYGPGCRAQLSTTSRLVSEDALLVPHVLDRSMPTKRVLLGILLRGRLRFRLRGAEVWIEAGDMVMAEDAGLLHMRVEGE